MPDIFTDKPEENHPIAPTTKTESAFARVSIMTEKPHKPGLFTAFAAKPIGLSFQTQESDEQIILLVRRHFITNVKWILTSIGFLLLSFILFPFLRSSMFSDIFFIPDTYLIVLGLLYYLLLIGFVLQQFATWFYHVGIITNFRVIDIDFHSLLSRNVAYTDVADIVDVEIVQGGFLHNSFDYGTVLMQTEGLKANFEFTSIPKPHIVADTISDLMRLNKGDKE